MPKKQMHRGHPMHYHDESGQWLYDDDHSPVATNGTETRPCGKCGEYRTKEGHDPCLGTLPGVVNACCGHGDESVSYVAFASGIILRGFVIDAPITPETDGGQDEG